MNRNTKRGVVRRAALVGVGVALTGLAVLACRGTNARSIPAIPEVPEIPGTAPTDPTGRVAFFVSGHSLTDDPLASDVVATAISLGLAGEYNEQIELGSPVRVRTRGNDPNSSGWSGYSLGKNRDGGSGLDVIAELRSPSTISTPYDALVITERHDVVGTLAWEDTVRYIRHVHDRLVEGNPSGITYVYHSWLDVEDKSDPSSFIAYERAMYPVWECIAERIETSLEATGSASHAVAIPAGIALADLVERAVAGQVPGLSQSSNEATLDLLFSDDVHLTRVGAYYMALVTFGSIYRRSPVGATAPAGVDAELATRLQTLAWEAVVRHHHPEPRGLASCRAYMRDVACDVFGVYRDSSQVDRCKQIFADDYATGPFHFDASTDGAIWFPAP